jgi:hypothetical protein
LKPGDPSRPDRPDQVSPGAGPKKAYVKPAFQHERVFETMALACGKVNGTSGQCNTNRKNS